MHLKSFLLLGLTLVSQPAFAQTRFTAADYARAEKFMTYNTTPLVYHSGVRPSWISGDRFYYRNTTAEGSEFILVDPAKGTRGLAFDHVKLAAALAAVAGGSINATRLPFQEIDVTPDGLSVTFNYSGAALPVRHAGQQVRRYRCGGRVYWRRRRAWRTRRARGWRRRRGTQRIAFARQKARRADSR